jgi:hypothetical protein
MCLYANINTSQHNGMDSIKIDTVQITWFDLNMKSLRFREMWATIYELSPQRNIPGGWNQVEVIFVCEDFVILSAFVYRTKWLTIL